LFDWLDDEDNDQIKALFCVMKSERMKTAMIPEISIQELADNIEFEDFSRNFGNPVKVKCGGRCVVLMSFGLYERLFGKVDLTRENTIEMDEFVADIRGKL